MAQLPPVILPADTWVNLYTSTGITSGNQLIIHNNGSNDAILADIAAQPVSGFGFDNIQPYEYLTTVLTPDGVWARSDRGTTLQVSEV